MYFIHFGLYLHWRQGVQELILVYMFWNFAQVKLWCQADCEQSEKYSNREFHLKLGRVNFPLRKISWFYFSYVPIQLPFL